MPLSNEGACAIEKMLNEDYDDEDPRMVQKKDKIMEILAEADESYVAVIPPKQMGIHFGNRDGDGISDDGVHTRGSLIVSAGFSHGTIEQDTIAMEDDPDTRSIAKVNSHLLRGSHGDIRFVGLRWDFHYIVLLL